MRHLLTPVPSIAAGAGPFLVRDNPEDAGGCCAPPNRKTAGLFQSPFSVSSPLALGIRAHEYGHLGLWRQQLGPNLRLLRILRNRGIHNAWIQGTLDVVVNHFMMARGNRDIAELLLWTSGLSAELPRWIAANTYLRAEGLRYGSLMRMSLLARRSDLTGDDLSQLDQASERLARWGAQADPLNAKQFLELLRSLQNRFGPDSPDAENSLARILVDLLPDAPGLEDYLVSAGASVPSCFHSKGQGGSDSIQWGPMDILTPPLIHSCRNLPGMSKRKNACGFTGAFRFPSRALLPATDGRAFTRRLPRSAHCGALLIDCSGSMREQVTHDRLMAVLQRSPSATIGLYAGAPEDKSGSLLIAARNGKHADREALDGWAASGNVVDGPALQWLARQKTPRVWVSDGGVTGLNDRAAINLQIEADTIVAMAHIRRVPTLDDYLEEWKGKGDVAPRTDTLDRPRAFSDNEVPF
ncbi:MAG: hypothetical protein ACLQLC_19120 [Candidatus Sulfotelmatobacter sp.]